MKDMLSKIELFHVFYNEEILWFLISDNITSLKTKINAWSKRIKVRNSIRLEIYKTFTDIKIIELKEYEQITCL